MLDRKVWSNIKKRRTGYENIEFYNRAAEKMGLTPAYLNVHDVSLPKRTAKGYIWRKGKYKLKSVAIPPVIHNRMLPTSPQEARLARRLAAKSYVFNQQNRYSKYNIHRLLRGSAVVRPSLPKTNRFSPQTFARMSKRFPQLYIKPQSGSVGKGILKLAKLKQAGYKLQTTEQTVRKQSREAVFRVIRSMVGQRPYIIQQSIPLATYNGNPYDIRVSVQRGDSGKWRVTGMVGKVARKGRHVTNVARGGRVLPCETLFASSGFDPEMTKRRVEQLSLTVARYLAKKLPHLADIGLDIGLDRQGRLYFIEMNGRDQRYSFHKGNMPETWYKTYENPMQYAKHLLRKKAKR